MEAVQVHRGRGGREVVDSGESSDALIGPEPDAGAGPALEETNNASSGVVDETTRRVKDLPAQGLGSRLFPGSRETLQLEPAHQVGAEGWIATALSNYSVSGAVQLVQGVRYQT